MVTTMPTIAKATISHTHQPIPRSGGAASGAGGGIVVGISIGAGSGVETGAGIDHGL